MLAPALLVALALTQLGSPGSLEGPIFSTPSGSARPRGVSSNVVFQAALTATGAAECDGNAPVATVGGAITTTRASSATCLKSDGTLVTLTNNQPAVAASGIQVAPSTTNLVLRSQEIDNAAWTDTHSIAADPTLNGANAGVAPDGTTTAEDYTFPATGAGEYTGRYQSAICGTTGTRSASVWVKGQAGSGTLDLAVHIDTGTYAAAACAFTSTAWTRCNKENFTMGAGALGHMTVGNLSVQNGGTARSSNRVYVWGAQCIAQTVAGPYVATAGSTVTRAADSVYAATPAGLSRTEGSARFTFTPAKTGNQPATYWLYAGAGARFAYTNGAASAACGAAENGACVVSYDGVAVRSIAHDFVAGAAKSFATTWSAAGNARVMKNLTDATSSSTTFTTWGAFDGNTVLGTGALPAIGTLSNVKLCSTAAATECNQ